MKEIWKDIPGYEGLYKISNYGEIYIIRTKTFKKLSLNKDGYYFVVLSKNNIKHNYLVHRLVAQTFLDIKKFKIADDENERDINFNLLTVNHKNKNRKDNRVINLEWCTIKYNVTYSPNNQNKYKEKINEAINYLNNNVINEKVKKDLLQILIII